MLYVNYYSPAAAPCPPPPQAHAGMSKVELNAYERFPEPREEDVLTIRECLGLRGACIWG